MLRLSPKNAGHKFHFSIERTLIAKALHCPRQSCRRLIDLDDAALANDDLQVTVAEKMCKGAAVVDE